MYYNIHNEQNQGIHVKNYIVKMNSPEFDLFVHFYFM